MIYVPNKFAFIHIPRTGGVWFKREIAKTVAGTDHQFHISTIDSVGGIHRHMRASELRAFIGEWQSIKVIAFDRPYMEIVESDYRLHQEHLSAGDWWAWSPDWRNEMAWFKSEKPTLEQFEEHRWRPWCNGDPVAYWCDVPGVDVLPFPDRSKTLEEVRQIISGKQKNATNPAL